MDKDLSTIKLVIEVKKVLESLDEDDRVSFLIDISEGYCIHCGYEERIIWPCQCRNDE